MKWLKRLSIAVLAIVLIVVAAGAGLYGVTTSRLRKTYDIKVAPVIVPTDEAAVAAGKHLTEAITKCTDCHGANLQGAVMVDDPAFGTLAGPNLTSGKGGVAAQYKTDEDWVRAIRHGVRPDGSALLIMPSEIYFYLNDADLGAVIAYLKTLPPQDNVLPKPRLGPVARGLFAAGKFPLLSVEEIDHNATRPAPVAPSTSVEYGKYLSTVGGCLSCHEQNLAGGNSHGPPGTPPATNLTPAGPLGKWTEEDFFRALRTGLRPDGSQINTAMPWAFTAKMTDDEIRATWAFLKSVPPAQSASKH